MKGIYYLILIPQLMYFFYLFFKKKNTENVIDIRLGHKRMKLPISH